MDSEKLLKIIHCYKISYLLFYTVEKGIYDHLLEPSTVEQLCTSVDYSYPEKMRIILNLLVGLGVLNKAGEKYALRAEYETLLRSNCRESMVPLINLERHMMEQHNDFKSFVASLEYGGKDNFNEQNKENMVNTYGQAMENGSRFTTLQVARIFRKIGKDNPKILDVGGGKGSYSLAILKCCPKATVHIFEKTEMVPICQENIYNEKMDKSISVFAYDIISHNFLERYDGILMSNILHLYNKETIEAMIGKSAAALNEGGLLVLHDFFLDDTHTEPLLPVLFTIDWLLIGGNFNYSTKDMELIGKVFGLKLIEIKRYKEIPTSILVFRKEKGSI